MVRGFCSRCHKEVGSFFRPLWQCPECRKIFCEECPKKRVGWWGFKKPACPDCMIEMKEGGLPKAQWSRQ